MTISLPPIFVADPQEGISEMLDSMILRYVPAFNGVVLAHSDLRLSSSKAVIQFDCPYATCRITFNALVWSPAIGMKLSAKINILSTDHIGLLAHDVFNVSIPKHHIPSTEFTFQHGPAENDPSFGAGAWGAVEDTRASPTAVGAWGEAEDVATGTWVRSSGGERLGGDDGIVEFIVVGLSTANNTLTLIGSLQPDPFSPSHVPETALSNPSLSYSTSTKRRRLEGAAQPDENDDDLEMGDPDRWDAPTDSEKTLTAVPVANISSSSSSASISAPAIPIPIPHIPSDSEDSDSEDVSAALLRKRAEAQKQAEEEQRVLDQERERPKDKKKKKRKEAEDPEGVTGVGAEVQGERKKKKKKRAASEVEASL
ncbi:hypothetical protein DL93DRAFT_2072219 [Clavulina sp. PMI_390]|nr:hypothetical protein DL93DRAFT_2072219 [Clavulina sp. PMI_390]